MKDLIKVKVLEATKGVSKITDQHMLTLKLEPLEAILHQGVEVGHVFTTVPDGDNEGAKGYRQAQLRYVLELNPFYQTDEILITPEFSDNRLITPEFSEEELKYILGKEFLAAIDVTTFLGGERLRVLDFYRMP